MDPRSTQDRAHSPPPHLPGTPPPGHQRQQNQGGATQDWAVQQNNPQLRAPEFRSRSVHESPERSNASVIILDRPHSDGGHQTFADRTHLARRTSRAASAINPLPPLPQEDDGMDGRMPVVPPVTRTIDTLTPTGRRSGIDWIVPVDEKAALRPRSMGERLEQTLLNAKAEKEKYAWKAKITAWALNVAIGLQVLLGALTTGLSAVTTGRQTSIMTAILGGLSTVVASYLARARGSNEPELSITRVKDLEQFIRECQAFQMDYGTSFEDEHYPRLSALRGRFEELLGNANGERKLSPV